MTRGIPTKVTRDLQETFTPSSFPPVIGRASCDCSISVGKFPSQRMRGRVPEYVAVCQSAGQYVRPTVGGGGGRLGVMPAGEPCPNGMSCSLLCYAVTSPPGICVYWRKPCANGDRADCLPTHLKPPRPNTFSPKNASRELIST